MLQRKWTEGVGINHLEYLLVGFEFFKGLK
jgi:hypothetical protein